MIARRRFSLEDQRAFATLSGDWNPLHVDPIAARRTLFAEPVVHGIHLVLWALDQTIERSGSLRHLTAAFRRPTSLDREVVLAREGARLIATQGDRRVLELEVGWSPERRTGDVRAEAWPEPVAPAVLARDDLEGRGEPFELALDHARGELLFPALAAHLPDVQLAELLATTRIVGMRCPGLHSIFAGLRLAAPMSPAGPVRPGFAVAKYAPRFSALSLAFDGPTLAGTIDAFYRPPPVEIELAALRARLRPDELAGRRAFVVGGSRGLGEALAKGLAAGGAAVCIGYRTGADDAARVAGEIGGHAFQFDVTAPSLAGWPVGWAPTHLYYCATPPIKLERAGTFSADDLARFIAYYVTGLEATIAACRKLTDGELAVWAPSTTFLDTHEPGAAAYCLAKAAMEELRFHLPDPVRLITPRLPRIATDQTAALIAGAIADPVDIAVEQLRAGA